MMQRFDALCTSLFTYGQMICTCDLASLGSASKLQQIYANCISVSLYTVYRNTSCVNTQASTAGTYWYRKDRQSKDVHRTDVIRQLELDSTTEFDGSYYNCWKPCKWQGHPQCHIIFGNDLYAALCVSMRVGIEHLTRTPLSHVLAQQNFTSSQTGHVIWWLLVGSDRNVGDPSWFESGLRLSGKQLRFLILLQHLVSEATCMSQNKRDNDGLTAFFFVFWVCCNCELGLFNRIGFECSRIALMWPVQNDFASIRHQKHGSVICMNILKCSGRNVEAVIYLDNGVRAIYTVFIQYMTIICMN